MEEEGEMGGCSVAAVKLILWLIASDKCCSSSASLCCCLVHAGCPVHSDTPLLLCPAVSWFRQQKRKLSFVAQFWGLFFFFFKSFYPLNKLTSGADEQNRSSELEVMWRRTNSSVVTMRHQLSSQQGQSAWRGGIAAPVSCMDLLSLLLPLVWLGINGSPDNHFLAILAPRELAVLVTRLLPLAQRRAKQGAWM